MALDALKTTPTRGAEGKQIACFPWADKRRDGRGGAGGGRHAPEEGGDGAAVRRIHRPAWYVRACHLQHPYALLCGSAGLSCACMVHSTVRSVVLRQIIGDAAAVTCDVVHRPHWSHCVRACRRVWDAGGAAGGHHVGAAGHPPQAGKLKRLALARSPGLHRVRDPSSRAFGVAPVDSTTNALAICLPRSIFSHAYTYICRSGC